MSFIVISISCECARWRGDVANLRYSVIAGASKRCGIGGHPHWRRESTQQGEINKIRVFGRDLRDRVIYIACVDVHRSRELNVIDRLLGHIGRSHAIRPIIDCELLFRTLVMKSSE